jgi:hypothetical protein
MDEQMDKVTLLDRIHKGFDELDALLISFTPEQMTTEGVNGKWTVKDVLVHLTVWEQRTWERLQAAASNEVPAADDVITDEMVNDFNERRFRENRERTLADVLADYHATYQRMVTAVQDASDEDLFQVGRFRWLGEDGNIALWQLVAGNTYEHIEEHIGSLRDWLEITKQAG